jgi:hypothetical protein
VRKEYVISIQKAQKLPPRVPNPYVSRRWQASIWLTEYPNPLITPGVLLNYLKAVVCGSIIDCEDFEGAECLSPKANQCIVDERCRVEARYHD